MSVPDWLAEGTMAKAQRDALIEALEYHDYVVCRAAARLQIGRSTVYNMMQRFGISHKSSSLQSKIVDDTMPGISFDGNSYQLTRRR